ncbi:TPA: hypothetical protein ACQ8UR_004519 [Escherichia coli]
MSRLSVIPFTPGADAEHDRAKVIEVLESALEAVKDNQGPVARSVALVIVSDSPDAVKTGFHSSHAPYELVGAIESLKVDFISVCLNSIQEY